MSTPYKAPSILLAGLLMFSATALSSAYASASYPDKPVTLIVPFPAGGNSDIVARVLAEGMAKTLGQPVIVNNRAGAGGQIGNQALVQAKPDGHTLLLGGMSTQILLVGTAPKLPYDPVGDFSAVALMSKVPLVLVVPASSPATDLKSFVNYLKSAPGAYNFSSAGAGTSGHITAQYFADSVGAEVVHVPYKGSAAALVDLVAGRNAYLVDTPPVVKELIASGKVRALTVFTDERIPDLSDVPTIAEAGFGDVVKEKLAPWQAIFAPSGVPEDVEQKINTAVNSALEMPTVKEKLSQLGFIQMTGSLADAKALFQSDYGKWLPILESMGFKSKQ